nr:C39 family peptidase [Comamonas sp. UBA7528]
MPAPSSLFCLAMLRAGQPAPGFRGLCRGLCLACGLIAAGLAQAAEPAVAAPADTGQGYAYFASLGQGSVRLPITSLRDGRLARTLIQQYDFSCGSAALATLLTHHYGMATTEQAVFEYMFATGDQAKIQKEGFSLLDMKRYLAQWGMQADGFALGLEKLAEARTPAIVLINENGYQHFVVVKGLEKDRVLLGDPAQGTRAMSRTQFDAVWPSRLLFVIHNRIGQGQFNLAQDWQVAPRSPLAQGLSRESLSAITLPKHGVGDF